MKGHRDLQKRGESETAPLKNEVYGFGQEMPDD
jgi:hypothetical protein